jgi:hypothetical protein
MKRAKKIFDWIPIVGGIPMMFGSARVKRKYMDYPDAWFEMNIITGCIALLAVAAYATLSIIKLME